MLASHTALANAHNTHRYDAAGCVDQLQLFVRLRWELTAPLLAGSLTTRCV